MKYLRYLIFLCLSLTALAACSGGGDEGCSAGSAQCACLPSGGCGEGLACNAGLCEASVCASGTEGCPCLEGACGQSINGDNLSCNDGVCQVESCPAGELSCACRMGTECTTGAACIEGVCQAQTCIPGTLGCECLAGSCNRGLTCSANVCADQTGRIGGACKSNGTCNMNARCDRSAIPASCVFCELGTFGCQCDANSACLPGLSCVNGHCAGDEVIQNRVPPANPVCHTPCQNDIINDDGTVRRCSPEGLMEGCLDGRICDNGSCVAQNAERRMCFSDGDCPEFQECMQGYCYSECSADADCANGQACHMTVCRDTCQIGGQACANGMFCGDSVDNTNGFCLPTVRTSTPSATPPPAGTFEVTRNDLRFTNIARSVTFQIINRSDRPQTFTIKKAEHALRRSNGSVERTLFASDCTSTACPLWWLSVGRLGQAGSRAGSTTVQVPANCEFDNSCPEVSVTANDVTAVAWNGQLTVESSLGSTSVNVGFQQRPEGRWRGQMVYFSNFSDDGIDSSDGRIGWLERPREDVDARSANDLEVRNGLIRRWGAFRTSRIDGGWQEMTAVLRATESEQWRWPSVERDCPAIGGACYLFVDDNGGGAGVTPYISDLDAAPIPAGVSTFPLALNLYSPDPNQPNVLSGRVVSDIALHYPGNPQVELRFATDPTDPSTSCDPRVRTNCVTFLQTAVSRGDQDGLSIELAVGGRYEKGNANCAPGFTERRLPWLVPGFLSGAQPANAYYERTWCVDSRLPDYTSPVEQITPEAQVLNRSLARSNPIPNGNVLRRSIQLLDGALIDQTQLFIMFRETYPSFLEGGRPIHAYGYVVLEREDVEIDRADQRRPSRTRRFSGFRPPAEPPGGRRSQRHAVLGGHPVRARRRCDHRGQRGRYGRQVDRRRRIAGPGDPHPARQCLQLLRERGRGALSV